jgi:DNA polymerase-3 subunit delta'
LSGVLGQPRVVAALQSACAAGRLAHAYLFVGPEGVGKATTARALAAALLCGRSAAVGEGCGDCPDCAAVRRGDHPDLVLAAPPEGKRSLPIATVQELAATLALRPARGPRRIAVLDGAERCTEEAANALLKTLEEPPGGALLVLIAADPSPLPATIRSRCQLLRFGPLPRDVIVQQLLAGGMDAPTASTRADRADGSLGAAWRGDADDAEAARELLGPLADPTDGAAIHAQTQAVLERCRTDAETAEAVREALSRLLAARIPQERAALREALAEATAGDPGGHAVEARLRALLAARRALRSNATPELVVETLLLQMSGATVAP